MDLIIFDLDGTLVDSRRDIATSVNELLARMGRRQLPPDQIYGFIGNGVRVLLERVLGGTQTETALDTAQEHYLSIYRRHLLDTTIPYPRVPETLEALRPGVKMAVLTNKPTPESLAVLQGLHLESYFCQVHGGESFPERKPNRAGVDRLIESTGARRDQTLMVGDSRVDFETARNAGIPVSLVTYGIGASDVGALSPDYVMDDFEELLTIVRSRP
jgi:phosphoglycolate phosphatase